MEKSWIVKSRHVILLVFQVSHSFKNEFKVSLDRFRYRRP